MSPGPRLTFVASSILIYPANGYNRHGLKIGGELCPFEGRETGSPCNTMWPGPRPTSVPSFTLIHPTVWPQYTNITDRQRGQTDTTDRQRSDSIGRTVLQTFAQKKTCYSTAKGCTMTIDYLLLLGGSIAENNISYRKFSD